MRPRPKVSVDVPFQRPFLGLIVNTGEQLEKKTAGKIKATLHQVVKPDGEKADKRLASIFFASWSSTFSLKPFEKCLLEMTDGLTIEEKKEYLNQYPDVTVVENLLSRLIEMGSISNAEEDLLKDLHSKGLLRQPPAHLKEKHADIFKPDLPLKSEILPS